MLVVSKPPRDLPVVEGVFGDLTCHGGRASPNACWRRIPCMDRRANPEHAWSTASRCTPLMHQTDFFFAAFYGFVQVPIQDIPDSTVHESWQCCAMRDLNAEADRPWQMRKQSTIDNPSS